MTLVYSASSTVTVTVPSGSGTTVDVLTIPPGVVPTDFALCIPYIALMDTAFTDQGGLGGGGSLSVEFLDASVTTRSANVGGSAIGTNTLGQIIAGNARGVAGGISTALLAENGTTIPQGTFNGGGTLRLRTISVPVGCTLRGVIVLAIATATVAWTPASIFGFLLSPGYGSVSGTFTPSTSVGRTSQDYFALYAGQTYDPDLHTVGSPSAPDLDNADTWQNVKVLSSNGSWAGIGYLPDVVDGVDRAYSFTSPTDQGHNALAGDIVQFTTVAATSRGLARGFVIG